MIESSEKFVEAMNGMKEVIAKEFVNSDAIKNMDSEQFNYFCSICKFVDAANELVTRQAEIINNINEKMDKLLEKIETE